jgi:hypothetical protein
MSRLSRRLPSPALVVAFVALCAALAGSAAALPGKNSVKKDDIAPRAVLPKHIAKGAPVQKLIYRASRIEVAAGAQGSGTTPCDSGFKATGGGVRADNVATSGKGIVVQSSFPNGLDQWQADVHNTGSGPATVTIWVVCETVAATQGEPPPPPPIP